MVNFIVYFLPTFPLDFAFDTLLLPYDIPSYYYHSHKVKEKRKKKKEEIEASHKRKITPDTDDGTDPNCSYPDCPYPNGTDDATATDGTDGDGTD
ncbi:MAG: hypothetical protein LBV28_04595 [Puniceicoccales bacterium]|nr:hypothetical protein [Puniceicoccales bacterium]